MLVGSRRCCRTWRGAGWKENRRDAIQKFFHGDDLTQAPAKMFMAWHHIAFDPETQRGYGEYTFRSTPTSGRYYHGIVSVQLKRGLIHRWREYQYRTEVPYAEFAAASLKP